MKITVCRQIDIFEPLVKAQTMAESGFGRRCTSDKPPQRVFRNVKANRSADLSLNFSRGLNNALLIRVLELLPLKSLRLREAGRRFGTILGLYRGWMAWWLVVRS
jgi:hypothetical protein